MSDIQQSMRKILESESRAIANIRSAMPMTVRLNLSLNTFTVAEASSLLRAWVRPGR